MTAKEIRDGLDALTIPTNSAHAFGAKWRPSVDTAAEYAEGMDYGHQWAAQDLRDSIPAADELARLESETRTESRRLRAFYLGALRGYRQVRRTLRDGKYGT